MIGDLHIHSRFSRACSKNINFENLVKWAKIKGVNLLGTGDFTHPVWFNEIKEKLVPNGKGIYFYQGFSFIISGEISLIYAQESPNTERKGRRVHLVVLVPNIEIAEKINKYLDTKGRRDYDGRPIFKISCEDFTKDLKQISKDIEIIPAHCLLPDSLISTNKGIKKIKDIKIGDFVLTHKGEYKKVKELYKRKFSGEVIKLDPSCLKIGSWFTPEHPIYAIKTFNFCKNTPHTICKPRCAYLKRGCKIKAYESYNPEWIQIKQLEKGDVVLYPRYKKIKDIGYLDLSKILPNFYVDRNYIKPRKTKVFLKNAPLNKRVKVSEDFCRLIGYYLAEGYVACDYVGFTFNEKEIEYLEDLKKILTDAFGLSLNIKVKKEKSKAISLLIYSKVLVGFFKMFYSSGPYRAHNKRLPLWFLDLPFNKIKQLLIGWWRGDVGITASLDLANQFKTILIKLGIIPSMDLVSSEKILTLRKKNPNFIGDREIFVNKPYYAFRFLCFFENSKELLNLPEFKKFKTKLDRRKGWIDKDYIYLPILRVNKKRYKGQVYNLEVQDHNSYLTENLSVHNCMTPWFGIFGSNSGFDSLKEAFGSELNSIYAIESGMSADPKMLLKLNTSKSIVSFSDAHSFWPFRIGREATIFQKTDSYLEIIRQIRENDFIATIETDPAYGKYHWDGHRMCDFSCSFEKTKELNGICPICKRSLTIGVENRVENLSDNLNYSNSKPYYVLLPLHEIIALAIKINDIQSPKVWKIYNDLINFFENEFNILFDISKEEMLSKGVDFKLVNLILQNRQGKIKVKPGFDGNYGKAILGEKQSTL